VDAHKYGLNSVGPSLWFGSRRSRRVSKGFAESHDEAIKASLDDLRALRRLAKVLVDTPWTTRQGPTSRPFGAGTGSLDYR
jgi:hypothetical protein